MIWNNLVSKIVITWKILTYLHHHVNDFFFLLKKHLVHFCRQFLSRQITVLNWIHNEKVMLDMNATSRSMAYLCCGQKYNRLRCLLRVKVLVICYLVWQYSTNQNQYDKGRFKEPLTCSSKITLSLPSYTCSTFVTAIIVCCIFFLM